MHDVDDHDDHDELYIHAQMNIVYTEPVGQKKSTCYNLISTQNVGVSFLFDKNLTVTSSKSINVYFLFLFRPIIAMELVI